MDERKTGLESGDLIALLGLVIVMIGVPFKDNDYHYYLTILFPKSLSENPSNLPTTASYAFSLPSTEHDGYKLP